MTTSGVDLMCVSFTLWGDEVDPSQIEATIGVPRTAGVKKGEENKPGHRASMGYYKLKVYSLPDTPLTEAIIAATDTLAGVLLPKKEAIDALAIRCAAQSGIEIGYAPKR